MLNVFKYVLKRAHTHRRYMFSFGNSSPLISPVLLPPPPILLSRLADILHKHSHCTFMQICMPRMMTTALMLKLKIMSRPMFMPRLTIH